MFSVTGVMLSLSDKKTLFLGHRITPPALDRAEGSVRRSAKVGGTVQTRYHVSGRGN